MYSFRSKALAIMIAFVLLFSNIAVVSAQPSDIAGHWAEAVMKKWIDYGVVQGFEGSYRPNDNISRAEFVVLLNRVLKPLTKSANIFGDISDKQWFAEDMLKAVHAGYIQGDGQGSFKPTSDITRQEAAVVLYKAFDMKPGNVFGLNLYRDGKDVADWAKDAFAALVENSYMTGKPGGRLAPKDSITRAETIVLLDKIAGELKNKAGTYTGSVEGNLVINTPDVVLKDMTIKGNLYIAQGVGEGDVYLDGVTVMGNTFVKGGGANSIKIKNSSLNGTLYVLKQDGKVRVVIIENTSVDNVEITSDVILAQEGMIGEGYGNVTVTPLAIGAEIVIEGDIDELNVKAPDASIEVLNGTVRTFTIADTAANTKVEVAKKAVVKNLKVEANVEITGTGTVEQADIKNEDAVIDEKLITPPTTPPSTGSGGGDDDDEDPYAEISSAVLIVSSGNPATTTVSTGRVFTIDISDKEDTDTISGITIAAPKGSTLQVNKVSWPGGEVNGNFNSISLTEATTTVSVTSLLEDPNNPFPDLVRTQVKVGTMRSIFGKQVVVEGTLSCHGYTSRIVKLTIILSE